MGYLVLIGDVVSSRRISERAQFQSRLSSVLQRANARAQHLASPYTLTLGDEFQAVYRRADGVFTEIFALLAQLAPVRVRFALAAGAIDTKINDLQAIGMDGPAFHAARETIDRLKAERRLFGVAASPAACSELSQTALTILSGLVDGWKPKRLEIFAQVLAATPAPAVALQTSITQRAVNKSIRAADLDHWRRLLELIERMLNQELEDR